MLKISLLFKKFTDFTGKRLKGSCDWGFSSLHWCTFKWLLAAGARLRPWSGPATLEAHVFNIINISYHFTCGKWNLYQNVAKFQNIFAVYKILNVNFWPKADIKNNCLLKAVKFGTFLQLFCNTLHLY